MFLPATTIANVQTQFNAQALTFERITITAIHATPKAAHIRYTMNEQDTVSELTLNGGVKLHEALDDSIRWNAYYLMEEILTGKELDEGIVDILRIWPAKVETNVIAMKDARVVKPQPTLDLTAGVSRLKEKFGGRK